MSHIDHVGQLYANRTIKSAEQTGSHDMPSIVPWPKEYRSPPAMRSTMVCLDELYFGEFCHQHSTGRDAFVVADLAHSIARKGLKEPIEFVQDDHGRKIIVRGHRRVAALYRLADQFRSGFSRNMQLMCREIFEKRKAVLLIWSLDEDNPSGRRFLIPVARKLHNAGVPARVAASTLGISRMRYERYVSCSDTDSERTSMVLKMPADGVNATTIRTAG